MLYSIFLFKTFTNLDKRTYCIVYAVVKCDNIQIVKLQVEKKVIYEKIIHIFWYSQNLFITCRIKCIYLLWILRQIVILVVEKMGMALSFSYNPKPNVQGIIKEKNMKLSQEENIATYYFKRNVRKIHSWTLIA